MFIYTIIITRRRIFPGAKTIDAFKENIWLNIL